MERQEYDSIVRVQEDRARRLPRIYRLNVLLLAVFGTVAFHLMLVLSIALILMGVVVIVRGQVESPLPIVAVVVGVFLAIFAIRALSFGFEPPTGVKATREALPDLWRDVDDLRAQLRAGPVHEVLLNAEHGAALVQTPRRGMIFGYRTTLICGVPLMLGLDAAQFKTVLAHEIGHLADGHGSTSAWSYRVHRVWTRVLEQTQHRAKHPLAWFARWFVPRFNARSVVLCRALEHHADRASVEACGVEPVGQALLRGHLTTPAIRKFWERSWRRAAVERDAPLGIFHDLAADDAVEEEAAWRDELARELSMRTEPSASHPCLADRLASVGYLQTQGIEAEVARNDPVSAAGQIALPARPEVSAARIYFGDRFDAMLAAVGESWATDVSESWDQRHTELVMNRGKLHLLDERAAAGTLTADDAVERARIVEMLEGDSDRLLSVLDDAVTRGPDNAAAHYHRGRVLLERHNPAGVESLERAMTLDPTSVGSAAQLLRVFYAQRNDHEAAEQIARRADDEARRVDLAGKERGNLNTDDCVVPHELPEADVRRIVAVLRTLPPVERAYLVRRAVKHYPELPAHALVVLVRPTWRPWVMRRHIALVAYELNARVRYTDRVPHHFVLDYSESAKALRKRYRRMGEHCIYDATLKTSGGRPPRKEATHPA